MTKEGNELSLDIVRGSDYEQLVNFLINFSYDNEEENKKFWKRRLDHWWVKNPIFSKNTIRGVKLVDKNEIVGFLGVIPLSIIYKEQEYLSYGLTTWRVNQQYRTQSIILLQFLLKELDGKVLFNNSANSKAYFIFSRLKFVPFYKEKYNCHYFVMRPLFINRFDSIILSKITEYGFSVIDLYQNLLFKKYADKYDIRILDNKYDDLDDLWLNSKNKFILKLKRTTEIIKWVKNYNGDRMIILGNYYNNKLGSCFIFMNYKYKMVLIDIWGEISVELIKAMIFNASKITNENVRYIEIPEYNFHNKNLFKYLWIYKRYKKDKRLIKIPKTFDQINNLDMYLTFLEGDKIHC